MLHRYSVRIVTHVDVFLMYLWEEMSFILLFHLWISSDFFLLFFSGGVAFQSF